MRFDKIIGCVTRGIWRGSTPTAAILLAALIQASLFHAGPACAATAARAPDAQDSLVLAGPEGTSFSFRPIYLKTNDSPLAGVRFIMGDPTGDFRAAPTAVVVGGSLPSNDPAKGSWMYWMGTFEVTEAQWDAVMGPRDGKPARAGSELPVTGISCLDAQNFADKLTRWLYANAIDSLPTSGPFPAYLRLPTEAEWEYAARGGSAVDLASFDASTAYGEDAELAEYEWFSGPTSSHNKVQPVGRLKPNPLGLHDMLGNVSEMTRSIYYVEYYQGRSGGFTARGGHYLTPEDKLGSALRTEEPVYLGSAKRGMRPNTKPTMGFRLVLAAPLLTGKEAIAGMEEAWETHRTDVGAAMPAALSVADVAARENASAGDAFSRLQRIREALGKGGMNPGLEGDLAAMEAALRSMSEIRAKADEESAGIWVKVAGERGMYLVSNLRGLAVTQEAPTENLRRRAEQFRYNVDSGLENYREIMTELAKLPREAVLKGFESHAERLRARIEEAKAASADNGAVAEARIRDLTAQEAWLRVTRAHYEKHAKEQRADIPAWRNDYGASEPARNNQE